MSNDHQPTVLVTGATGNIGRPLVHELKAQQGGKAVRVRAAVRSEQRAAAFREEGIETALFDFDKPETFSAALRGVDRVFLLTGNTSAMVTQSKSFIDAAKQAAVKHVVKSGAWAVDGTTHGHLRWHQEIEKYIEASGMGFTHLRPNWFMQNVPSFFMSSTESERGTIYGYIGNARVSWVDTNDIARVAAAVLCEPGDHAGRTYPLAVEALSFNEVAGVLSEVVGKPFRYVARDPKEFLSLALSAGTELEYAKSNAEVFESTGNGTITEVADVFDNFQALTGQQPTLWKEFALQHKELFDY